MQKEEEPRLSGAREKKGKEKRKRLSSKLRYKAGNRANLIRTGRIEAKVQLIEGVRAFRFSGEGNEGLPPFWPCSRYVKRNCVYSLSGKKIVITIGRDSVSILVRKTYRTFVDFEETCTREIYISRKNIWHIFFYISTIKRRKENYFYI